MSSERSNNSNRPLKPTLAASRPARPPLTPRVATSNATRPTLATVRSEPLTPKVRQTHTPVNGAIAKGNVNPRSSARLSRTESANASPTLSETTPSGPPPRSAVVSAQGGIERSGSPASLSVGGGGQGAPRASRPKSFASESGSHANIMSPLVRSPPTSPNPGLDARFFHASDGPRQKEPAPQKPEAKKAATFFYADGKQESESTPSANPASPVLSAVSDQKSTGPWIRSETSKSPSIMSPGLSTLSSTSPFFGPATTPSPTQRSPSPSKENIHLSYRRGVSQIIGTRPAPTSRSTAPGTDNGLPSTNLERRGSLDPSISNLSRHHKSPSLSSIDSGSSQFSRRRSTTTAEIEPKSSPLANEVKAATIPRPAGPPTGLPSIDDSLDPSEIRDGALSPSKGGVSELAAEARRERKVLDLEISNSSLLAINSSLEREVRRQKAELKRFRRLSRAGRFSLAPGERLSRPSDDLYALGEEDEDDDSSIFGPPSALGEWYDDMSDDDESLASSAEPLSPSAQSARENDRLAKDERRLQVDLQKHKELLQQSQAMNQSIKRCTYATEDMIRDGRKALDYQVRVSDVKLGGRVLSNDEDDEDSSHHIEVEDEFDAAGDGMDQAKGFLDVWAGVGGRPSLDGDRDSGIEVDRTSLPPHTSMPAGFYSANSGQPSWGGGGLTSLS